VVLLITNTWEISSENYKTKHKTLEHLQTVETLDLPPALVLPLAPSDLDLTLSLLDSFSFLETPLANQTLGFPLTDNQLTFLLDLETGSPETLDSLFGYLPMDNPPTLCLADLTNLYGSLELTVNLDSGSFKPPTLLPLSETNPDNLDLSETNQLVDNFYGFLLKSDNLVLGFQSDPLEVNLDPSETNLLALSEFPLETDHSFSSLVLSETLVPGYL